MVVATMVLVTVCSGIAWALTGTRGKRVSVSASYTIQVAAGESKEQVLFTVGDVAVATECAAWWEFPDVFMVGGKAGTVTNNGADAVLLVVGEGGAPIAAGTPVQTLPPGDGEAFGNVGGAATNNDRGSGGLLPFAILEQGGTSASGTLSFWYDVPDNPNNVDPLGTCVITAQMHG